MGTIQYNPAPGEPQVTTFRGIRLEAGQSVNVKDSTMLRKLDGHPQFEVSMDDKERERAQQFSRDPNAGVVTTTMNPLHRPYYETGGGVNAIDGEPPEGSGPATVILTPTSANAAGGGLNGPTIGDDPARRTRDGMIEHYGSENPLDAQEPGEPRPPSGLKQEAMQVQAERAEQQQAPQQAPRPRGRPPGRRAAESDE